MLFLPHQAWSNSVFCLDNKGFALHEGKRVVYGAKMWAE